MELREKGIFPDILVGGNPSIREFLDGSSFDELIEFDLEKNSLTNIYHVNGKYYFPIVNGNADDIVQYCSDHMVHPDDKRIYLEFMDATTMWERLENAPVKGVVVEEFRYRLVDGGWRWVLQLALGGEEHGLESGIVYHYVFDIQNQKDREAGLMRSGHFTTFTNRDMHTGLLVDQAFFMRARVMLESIGDEGFCLVAIDIEHFKLFNDWYGREAGDYVLAQVGYHLKEVEKEAGGLAGYLGLDDFCVLMPNDPARVEKLFADLSNVITAKGASIGFMPAFGVCVVEPDTDIMDLYDCAELAASYAKEGVKHRIRYFESSMYELTKAEYRVLTDFHRGLANGEIFFMVQPQCRIADGKIVGVECLARWRREDGTMVPPNVFVPVLEKHGFITDLDTYIWESACKSLKEWLDAGHVAVPLSINVSRVDIHMIDVARHMEGLVQAYDLPHGLVKVEITESAYAESEVEVKRTVRELREKGFTVMMDDFGSGYSSLNVLGSLNVDVIKLDAVFMRMGGENIRRGINIVESIVNMAKTMALPIVAEGVETKEQSDFLQGLGCQYVQGFGYYRPMELEAFRALIADGNIVASDGLVPRRNEEFRIREFLDRNVYSDSMLNSIIGSVALYSLHEGKVDIVRYNEQFYEAVGITGFNDRLEDIGNYMPEEDSQRMVKTLERAERNELSGAAGIFRFYKPDGSTCRFDITFHYLQEKGVGKLFYGSVSDVTERTELRNQMRLLSMYTPKTIVFIRKRYDGPWSYRVVIHGAEDDMGVSQGQLQRELNDGWFSSRARGSEAQAIEAFLANPVKPGGINLEFAMERDDETLVTMRMWSHYIEDTTTGDNVILAFERVR